MGEDEQEASELIRQGRYFEQARQWYSALYIAPIPERSLFLMLVLLSLLVGLMSAWAVISMLPLKDRPIVMISNTRINDIIPRAVRMRQGDESINNGLRRFFVNQYVVSRETYLPVNYAKNVLFVTAHSSADLAATYAASVSPDNPRNPVAILGAYGTRSVTINSIAIYPGTPQVALVKFSTETGGTAPPSKTQWTARIEFNYSDAVVTQGKDPVTGEKMPNMQEPQFQVVKYEVTAS